MTRELFDGGLSPVIPAAPNAAFELAAGVALVVVVVALTLLVRAAMRGMPAREVVVWIVIIVLLPALGACAFLTASVIRHRRDRGATAARSAAPA
ncbi:hypothetical protein [Galbitalea soli]|uniref:Cardiolipin synthase N-terminal domain-containing protein n=1 Tax=Galbitalea soli TaxID=1268042 RepID=A0A7C9PPK9_9MICO|nr:hypothetical protein [Galbitalea soli]NEM92347.1 hypothetical protein [Galbitalea soli]NYJ31696.1 hypothetical protein [Galbitalea soli]